MESNDARSTSEPADATPDHQLAGGGSPLSRLTGHAKGLSGDVRAWLELRYKLAKIELFERLDEQADQLVLYAIVGALGAVGGLVLLLATCFGVSWIISALTGWTLGALTLGFLVVAVGFFMLAGLFFSAKPRFGLFKSKTRATVSEAHVTDGRRAGGRSSSEGAA